jgi:hypothetical protein
MPSFFMNHRMWHAILQNYHPNIRIFLKITEKWMAYIHIKRVQTLRFLLGLNLWAQPHKHDLLLNIMFFLKKNIHLKHHLGCLNLHAYWNPITVIYRNKPEKPGFFFGAFTHLWGQLRSLCLVWTGDGVVLHPLCLPLFVHNWPLIDIN